MYRCLTAPRRSKLAAAAVAAVLSTGMFAADARAAPPHLRVRDQIENETLSSPEMRDALKSAAAARRAYDYARNQALAELEKNGDYRSLRMRQEALQEELDGIYFAYRYGIPPREDTAKLAREIYKLGKELSRHEARALSRDAAVREAKADLLAAGQTLITMRREIPFLIRSDPRFQSARR